MKVGTGAGIEEPVTCRGKLGLLRGVRHRGEGPDSGWTAVIQHGWFSATHVGPARMYVQVARLLADLGVEVLRYSCYGVGDSDGDFSETSYESELDDYRTILDRVQRADPERRLAVIGHSLGGSHAVRLAAENSRIERVLLISPTCGPITHLGNLFKEEQIGELERDGVTERKATLIRKSFLDAIHDESIFALAARVEAEVLIFYGTGDKYFDLPSKRRLLDVLPRGRLVEIEGGDHNFLKKGYRARFLAYFAREIGALWGTS